MQGWAEAGADDPRPSFEGERGSSLLTECWCSALSGDDSVELWIELDWEFKIRVKFGVGEAGAESRRSL